jgi:cation diffusion facilitator family transporter
MDRTKAGLLEGFLSIIVNALLFVLKIWVSIITGSIALAADAWHTLSDSLTSIIVIFGVKLSSKKADKEHPFGHGRWEQIASIFVAVILAVIAYDFLKSSIVRFNHRESVTYGIAAIIVVAFSIIVKELMAQYAFYIGRKTGNASITADGWHHRSDSLSSIVVLAGILFAKQFWWIDSVLGIFTALVLFYAAFTILREIITKLLGEEPSQEIIAQITNEIKNIYNEDLNNLHHFHIHDYVVHKELTLHLRLNKDMTIEEGHKIATAIEDMISEKFNMDTTIHVEPLEEKL